MPTWFRWGARLRAFLTVGGVLAIAVGVVAPLPTAATLALIIGALAKCGNSGNTSEPHVHLQVMDHGRLFVAAGLPFVLAGGELPANEKAVVV